MSFRKVQAKLVLAWLFLIHLIKRLFSLGLSSPGLKGFLESFREDGIFPVEKGERERFADYQKCQACSLCAFSCSAIQKGKAPPSFEPKSIMLGIGRSSHEAEVFLEDWIPCLECGECSVLCPNAVPVHAMAMEVKNRRMKIHSAGN